MSYKNQLNQQTLKNINDSKQRCRQLGLDPTVVPEPDEISDEQLEMIQLENRNVLKVVEFFIPEFLTMVKGTPLLIVVTNNRGIVTYIEGDATVKHVVQKLGFRTGVQFTESHNGTNSISLALHHNEPIGIIGSQHYHDFLDQSACYSVPFHDNQTNGILGTVSIMTAVDFATPLLLSLLSIVGTSIEREILLRKRNSDLHILNQVMMDASQTAMILTDPRGRIMELNHYAEKITGLTKENILNEFVWQFDQVADWLEKVIQMEETITDVEVALTNRQTGETTYCLFDGKPIYSEYGELLGTVSCFRDITERYENQQVLNRQAHHDELTGVPNRRFFQKYVGEILQEKRGPNEKMAIFLLDLDRFKFINDTLGHAKGDKLLYDVSNRLQDCLNNRGKLFRLGGDEFTIVLENIQSQQEVITVAQDVLAVVRDTYIIEDLEFRVSASIGIALYPDDGDSINELLMHADIAMYEAKRRGKNGFVLYSSEMKEQSLQNLLGH